MSKPVKSIMVVLLLLVFVFIAAVLAVGLYFYAERMKATAKETRNSVERQPQQWEMFELNDPREPDYRPETRLVGPTFIEVFERTAHSYRILFTAKGKYGRETVEFLWDKNINPFNGTVVRYTKVPATPTNPSGIVELRGTWSVNEVSPGVYVGQTRLDGHYPGPATICLKGSQTEQWIRAGNWNN